MNRDKITKAVQSALIADSYLLGSHWVYEPQELLDLTIDWNELNPPSVPWHEGKERGDFTHYGDHAKWLVDFIEENNSFDIKKYKEFWLEKIEEYKGYIDGSVKETLAIMQEDKEALKGSHSHDLSLVGTIAPLLYVSSSKKEFVSLSESYMAFTHNNERVLSVTKLFASLLYDVIEAKSIEEALESVEVSRDLQEAFNAGVRSKNTPSVATIQKFGAGCPVEGGFEGTLHLLAKYTDFKEAMLANAKAGGDSAARGMVVAMMMGATGCEVPSSWREGVKGV